MGIPNNHFYLVKSGNLYYPKELHNNNTYEEVPQGVHLTPWGYWLPFNRNSLHLESTLNSCAYTQDSPDITGLMIGLGGEGVWLEINGDVFALRSYKLNVSHDIITQTTGIPDVFKMINTIKPKLNGPAMIDLASEIIPIRSRNIAHVSLAEIDSLISPNGKGPLPLSDFVLCLRNFHSNFTNADSQFSLKLKVNQGHNLDRG